MLRMSKLGGNCLNLQDKSHGATNRRRKREHIFKFETESYDKLQGTMYFRRPRRTHAQCIIGGQKSHGSF